MAINFVLSEEAAQEQLERILDFYEIDRADLPEDQKVAYDSSTKGILKGFRLGRLDIIENDKGFQIKQILRSPPGDINEIVYGEIGARAKRSMDGIKVDNQYRRMYTFLGSASGLGCKAIESLKGADLSLAESLAIFFQM